MGQYQQGNENIYMIDHEDTLPWHNQPLVWMIISIPVSAVIVCMILLYLAITTDDGLVADDYYKQGMAINRKIARDVTANTMQLTAEVEINTAEDFIKAKFNKGTMERFPSQLQLVLRHASAQQKDKYITLQHGIGAQYVGAFNANGADNVTGRINPGMWYVELSNADSAEEDWRLSHRVRLGGATQVLLQAK